MKSLLVVLLGVGYLAPAAVAQQINTLEQGATIWFYRPADSPSPRDIPTLFEIAGITRQLARLGPGEFFGYSVPAGIHVFSYTRAPSRNESTTISVRENQQAYIEVQWRGLREVSHEMGSAAIRKSRPISEINAKDESVILVPSVPVTAGPPMLFASLPIRPASMERIADARQVSSSPAPIRNVAQAVTPLPVITTLAPMTATPAPAAAAPLVLPPATAVAAPVAAPPPPAPAVNAAPPSRVVSAPVTAAPVAVAPAASASAPAPVQPAPREYVPIPLPNETRSTLASQPFAFTEVFPKATLNVEVDKKKQEIDATIGLDRNFFWVLDKRGTALKTFAYATIRTVEYAYGNSPRWKGGSPVATPVQSSGKKHWLMVRTQDEYALIQLDKTNYKPLLAAFESRSGKKIETVADSR